MYSWPTRRRGAGTTSLGQITGQEPIVRLQRGCPELSERLLNNLRVRAVGGMAAKKIGLSSEATTKRGEQRNRAALLTNSCPNIREVDIQQTSSLKSMDNPPCAVVDVVDVAGRSRKQSEVIQRRNGTLCSIPCYRPRTSSPYFVCNVWS
jgi:hypothetical protein